MRNVTIAVIRPQLYIVLYNISAFFVSRCYTVISEDVSWTEGLNFDHMTISCRATLIQHAKWSLINITGGTRW